MGAFSKPWRRKIGIVTLLVACVAMAGWMRSQIYFELVEVPISPKLHYFELGRNGITWLTQQEMTGFVGFLPDTSTWTTIPNNPDVFDSEMAEQLEFEWRWKCCGFIFEVSNFSTPTRVQQKLWTIPFWAFVWPSVAVSAYLLLSKPRPPKQPAALTASSDPVSVPSGDPIPAESIPSQHS